jgi:hypothetical protein
MTMKQATMQKPLLGNGSATDTEAAVPQQQENTIKMGCGVFYMVGAEML